jgi:hypothetical protein
MAIIHPVPMRRFTVQYWRVMSHTVFPVTHPAAGSCEVVMGGDWAREARDFGNAPFCIEKIALPASLGITPETTKAEIYEHVMATPFFSGNGGMV